MTYLNLKSKGFPTLDEIKKIGYYPSNEEFKRGPMAVIECIEEIPCNPCEQTCNKGAIKIGRPITNIPQMDVTKCTGCGLCMSNCPGLAIYIKDYMYAEDQVLIAFPYEFFPLPTIGQKVIAVDRQGKEVCEGTVIKIYKNKINDQTVIITMVYPKNYFHEVISMKRLANL
jgi:Fe-S-cluster-containing hydrogenase component 2